MVMNAAQVWGVRGRVRTAAVTLTLMALMLMTMAATAADYRAPRLKGTQQPDLNGIWQAMNEANWDVERHMARAGVQLREGPAGPVPAVPVLKMGTVASVPPGIGVIVGGGKIPYTQAGLKKKQENQADWANRDPEVKCFLPGVPRATYMPQPFQIFHNPNSVFIAYQYAGAVRDILLTDPGEAPVDSWMGQSYGKWEGNTLVVEVTGQVSDTWFDRSGNHHSEQLKVTERYTPMSPNHLWYEARVEDPVTFTEPWTIAMPLYRRMEPGMQLMDFKCVEFVEELMYGEFRRSPLPR
jgi:hypothetical protein